MFRSLDGFICSMKCTVESGLAEEMKNWFGLGDGNGVW